MFPFFTMHYSMNIRSITAKLNGESFHLNALFSKFSNFNHAIFSEFGIINLRALNFSIFRLSIFNVIQMSAKKKMARIDALRVVALVANKLICRVDARGEKIRNSTGFKVSCFILLKKISTSSIAAYINGCSPKPAVARLVDFIPEIFNVSFCKIRHGFNRTIHTYLDAETLMGVAL